MVKVIHIHLLTLLIVALSISNVLEKLEFNRTETNRNTKDSLLSKLPITSGRIIDLKLGLIYFYESKYCQETNLNFFN